MAIIVLEHPLQVEHDWNLPQKSLRDSAAMAAQRRPASKISSRTAVPPPKRVVIQHLGLPADVRSR